MELINGNAFATARYDASRQIVYYHFTGLTSIPLGLETLRKVMTFATAHKVKGIVSDLSTMQGTFTAANEFFEKEYYPHMIKHGLRCTGIVLSNDIFTKFAANELKRKAGSFQLQIFENRTQAESWVLSSLSN